MFLDALQPDALSAVLLVVPLLVVAYLGWCWLTVRRQPSSGRPGDAPWRGAGRSL